jgi:hypothetical protein
MTKEQYSVDPHNLLNVARFHFYQGFNTALELMADKKYSTKRLSNDLNEFYEIVQQGFKDLEVQQCQNSQPKCSTTTSDTKKS